MEMVLIFTFCLILAGTDAVTTVTGYRGRSVQIKCNYTSGYEEYNKYLCRGECPSWPGSKDIPVKSGSQAKDSRFSLYGDTIAKVFTVTITDLRPEDAGTYWCVIERAGSDIYTEIQLLVEMDVPVSSTVSQSIHTTSTLIKTSSVHAGRTRPTTATQLNEVNNQTIIPSSHDIPGKPGYIVMGAGAVLFVVAMIIAIYCKIKHQGSEAMTQSPRKINRAGERDQYALSVQAQEKDTLPECVYQNLDPALHQLDLIYQNMTITNNL